jgi:hypothetical protein
VEHKYDAFISYSHADKQWVTDFAARLADEGLRIARDEVFLQFGDDVTHSIEQAIRDSAHGILVFSPASVSSGWVRLEYSAMMRRSIENGRRFIPVIIGDVELPEFAATRLAADFRKLGADEHGPVITKIAAALRS